MTTTTVKTDLVSQHSAAITARETATNAGVRAGASRKIANLELEMTIQGVEFTPWTPPAKTSSSYRPSRSDDDLVARLDTVTKIANGDKYPASVKTTASQEVARLTAMMAKRGIEVPDATTPAKRTKVAA